eukprot:m.25634 g.25634  ORF g.25634 m.25634 type:complete len:492 (-) comp6219_c0_seq1:40-1515(-)
MQRLSIQNLPPEIFVAIVGQLALRDILRARLVCRTWAQMIDSATVIWRNCTRNSFRTGCARLETLGLTGKAAFLHQCKGASAWRKGDRWESVQFGWEWGEVDLTTHDTQAYRAHFSRDVSILVTAHGDGTLRLHDVGPPQRPDTAGHNRTTTFRHCKASEAVATNSVAVVAMATPHTEDSGSEIIWTGAMDSSVSIWDLHRPANKIHIHHAHSDAVVCLHGAGGVVLSGSLSGETRLWTGPSIEESALFNVHAAMVVTVRVGARPDRDAAPWLALSGGNDYALGVYDVWSKTCLMYCPNAHRDCIGTTECFGGSSTLFITGADDGEVTVWNFGSVSFGSDGMVQHVSEQDMARLQVASCAMTHHWITGIRYVASPSLPQYRSKLRPHGDRIIVSRGDGRIDIVTTALDPLWSLCGHTGIVCGLAVTLCGRHLISASESDRGKSEVYVWDLDSGVCTHRLPGAMGRVTALAASDSAVFAATPNRLHLWRPYA